jgi:hypothetical protein
MFINSSREMLLRVAKILKREVIGTEKMQPTNNLWACLHGVLLARSIGPQLKLWAELFETPV